MKMMRYFFIIKVGLTYSLIYISIFVARKRELLRRCKNVNF